MSIRYWIFLNLTRGQDKQECEGFSKDFDQNILPCHTVPTIGIISVFVNLVWSPMDAIIDFEIKKIQI